MLAKFKNDESYLIKTLYHYRFYILTILFAATILIFWPGQLQPDSRTQYIQALSGLYGDHHPPLMLFVWRYLNVLYEGPATMFILQLCLLYAGLWMLLKTVDLLSNKYHRSLLSLIVLIFPIYPQVLIYSVSIVKDTQFAFSFLLANAILAYYTIKAIRPPLLSILCILFILIYGAAVKYQGQFCVIVTALWLGILLLKGQKLWQKIAAGLLLYGFIFGAITTINDILVPQRAKSYAWQLVKFYDLAAISIAANEDLIPVDNKKANYSFTKLKSLFKYPAVDTFVFGNNAILKINSNKTAVSVLYKAWFKAIIQHPWLYIIHRSINISYTLLSRPGYIYALDLVNKIPSSSIWHNIAYYTSGVLFFALMSHLPVVIIGICYFGLAIYSWRESSAAPVLLGLVTTALVMVAMLFFMSMAGTPRYTYMSIVLIHAGHIFAYNCFRARSFLGSSYAIK